MRTFARLVCKFFPSIVLALLLFCTSSDSFADASSASLSITISDASGASVPDASIVLQNNDTNQQQDIRSSRSGTATFSFLKPGHYSVTISKHNFSDIAIDKIVLNVGDARTLALVLKVGSATETVTVDGSGPTINMTDAAVGTVIDRKFVENIPLNGRSFQDLISMTPGVLTQTPQNSKTATVNDAGDFSVNGQRTESNYYLVDGVTGNIAGGDGHGGGGASTGGNLPGSTALGTTQTLVSVDALQEFRVLSSTYSAEYGRTPGGQFSLVSRSGTNILHGSAFDYLRNNYFDANNWFNDHYGTPTPPLRQNDFGGTLGGPIMFPRVFSLKNRSFFFVSYEGLRLTQPQAASVQYVPDTNIRQQALSIIQPILNAFPKPTGPAQYVPCTSGATSGFPCPMGSPVGTLVPSGLALFTSPYSLPSSIDSTSFRLDQVFSPKLTVFFRFADTPSSTALRVLSSFQKNRSSTYTYTAGATSQFSGVTNDLRLGYIRANSAFIDSLDSFGGAIPTSIPEAEKLTGYGNPQAYFEVYAPGVGSSLLQTQQGNNQGRQWNITDTLGFVSGHHQFKMGVDFRRIKSVIDQPDVTELPIFESITSELNGRADALSLAKGTHTTPIFNETSLFVQDEWRVVPSLSISMGLRWELNPPPTEQHGRDAYTIAGNLSDPSSLTLAPLGTPLWDTTYHNFAPRLGVAWQVRNTSGWETVVRTGVGVFFDNDNEPAYSGFVKFGYDAAASYSNTPFPASPEQLSLAPTTSAPYTSEPIYAYPKHLQLPYTLQWNVSVQQGLGKAQTLTFSYVGANGRRLLQEQEYNLGKVNKNFGTVYELPGNITSSYNGLQVQFQRAIARGIQALASYTWSHSLDFGSTYTALPLTRGNSDFDVRNNFQAGLSWELPSVKANSLTKAVINGWALDARVLARTAYPITLTGNLETDPATGTDYYGGVNYDPSRSPYLYGPQYPGGKALNGGANNTSNPAFTLPSGTASGNAPRNFVRGFGESQLNLAVRRAFTLHEGVALQFRAESFNLPNHPSFGYVDPTLTDATFGQATQTLNQSLATVASQYQQGGSRSMQFALKLLF